MSIVTLLIKTNLAWAAGVARYFEPVILIIPCFTYFKEIFSRQEIGQLDREPSFWMVTGILFYFLLAIPTIWFTGFYVHEGMFSTASAVYSINNYSQIITYILFIKGMTCAKKKLC